MSGVFKRPGVACANCDEPFSLLLTTEDFVSVEKLPDPFHAKCPACQHRSTYPKSAIRVLAAASIR